MKINIKKILVLLMFIILLFSLTGCELLKPIEKRREEKLRKLYDQISQIETKNDYAFIYDGMYVSSTEEISFASLIEEKISQDGNKTKNLDVQTKRMDGDIVLFYTCYKKQNRFFGLNNQNCYYAVGTISLVDYNIDIKYFNCEFEKIHYAKMNENYYVLSGEDYNIEDSEGQNVRKTITIDRKTKEVKICNSYDSAINYCGEVIEYYSNPNIYIEEGIQYEVSSDSITYADDIYLVPECSHLVEESEELKQIIEILGGQKEMYTLEGNFFTNGEELFIGFISDVGMFGYESDLRFPIIFKCSINSDIFEYVGCVFYKDVHFYEDLEVIKLN